MSFLPDHIMLCCSCVITGERMDGGYNFMQSCTSHRVVFSIRLKTNKISGFHVFYRNVIARIDFNKY